MQKNLQEKLVRLDREREAMYQSVEGLSEEQLHDIAYGWSVIQVFSHLNDSEKGSVSYMKKKMQAGEAMKNYSAGNRIRMTISKGVLQSGLKWKAPKYIASPEGKYSLKEMMDIWEKTRTETRAYVKEYPEELLNKAVFKHPFAGRLNLANAIDSITYHQRHHMHQLKRIKKAITK